MEKKFGKSNRVPGRGDVVWLDFNPQAGAEQAGHRPALILSPIEYNKAIGLAIVCPITTKVKKYPFEVLIPEGTKLKGAILADHIKSVDWRVRKVKHICTLSNDVIEEVLDKLGTLLK